MQPDEDQWRQPTSQPAGVEVQKNVAEQTTPSRDGAESAPFQASSTPDDDQVVRWQATEYIHRDRSPMWYAIFGIAVLAMMALAIFLVRSVTFAILIPVMAAALVVYSRRPPSMINYTLSRKGLHIDDKLYPYEQFKEFGLIQGDDQHSVMLVPRERFKPGVTVYFPEEAGEAVIDMLVARLPMHEVQIDSIDRLIRKLKL